jgi:multimeric flavodoxin WrbA
MKAMLLDGSSQGDPASERIIVALSAELEVRGWEVEHVVLRDRKIGNCAGDFYCWIRSPGICNVDDDNRLIAAGIVASDLVVYLTPVTFGGYSSNLKRMLDHQIQNVSPFFTTIEGEIHHRTRYAKNPDLLAVGWMDGPDERAAAVFRHLVQRNALNLHARTSVAAVVTADLTDRDLQAAAKGWLGDIEDGRTTPPARLHETHADVGEVSEVRRALLLVGSPRTRKSTSYVLGGHLYEQLQARSIQVETMYPHTVLRSVTKAQALLDAVEDADLVTLACPLYVDSLPAPVIEMLERMAAHRRGRHGPPQLFTAIVNCGFPEVVHNATALAICEAFARQAGFEWAGSLALGGGGALDGAPLTGRRTAPLRRALDLAAAALAEGRPIPAVAQAHFGQWRISPLAYRTMGNMAWYLRARPYGVWRSLKLRPYETNQGHPRAARAL